MTNEAEWVTLWHDAGPWTVTDNSGSFIGHGWRLSAEGKGFEVWRDNEYREARIEAATRNRNAAAVASKSGGRP